MTFEEMTLTRQSTRSFSNKEVEEEKILKICEIARLTPSACNSQPWKLHIFNKNSENLNDLRKACQVVGLNKFLDQVNDFIVVEQVFGNMSATMGSKMGNNDLNSIDIGILTAHICYAAHELGLHTCIIGAFRDTVMRKAMNFNDKQKVRIVVAVGYESDNYPLRKKVRKDFDKLVEKHY